MDSPGEGSPASERLDLHALKNRLTVVKGLAQLLERQLRRDDWTASGIIAKARALVRETEELEHMIDAMTTTLNVPDRVSSRWASREDGHHLDSGRH